MIDTAYRLRGAASDIETAIPFMDGSIPNLLQVVKKGLLNAADEIERLTAELDQARAELREAQKQDKKNWSGNWVLVPVDPPCELMQAMLNVSIDLGPHQLAKAYEVLVEWCVDDDLKHDGVIGYREANALRLANQMEDRAESAESKNASLTQEREQLRAGYAGVVEAVRTVLHNMQHHETAEFWSALADRVLATKNKAHAGYGKNVEANFDILREALSSTPQSVKDVMDVLEAAKKFGASQYTTYQSEEEQDLHAAVRKLEAK